MTDIAWLIDDTPPREIVVDDETRIDAPDIRGAITAAELTPELFLYLSEIDVLAPCAIEPYGDLPGDWIDIHFLARGEALFETTDGHRGKLDSRSGLVFRLSERRGRFHLPVAAAVRSVGVAVSAERLAMLLGDEMPAALEPLLRPGGRRAGVLPFRVGTALRRLGAGFFSKRPPQVLRRLYLEAQALQFVALALAELPTDVPADAGRPLSAREAAMVAEARARLEADLRDPPAIAVLAASLGLSASRLAEGLRTLYGATAFEIVRNARLDHARLVLETTEMPLKVLAYRVGYSDVTNFIHAFRGRFGCPPGRYARSRVGTVPAVRSSSRLAE